MLWEKFKRYNNEKKIKQRLGLKNTMNSNNKKLNRASLVDFIEQKKKKPLNLNIKIFENLHAKKKSC